MKKNTVKIIIVLIIITVITAGLGFLLTTIINPTQTKGTEDDSSSTSGNSGGSKSGNSGGSTSGNSGGSTSGNSGGSTSGNSGGSTSGNSGEYNRPGGILGGDIDKIVIGYKTNDIYAITNGKVYTRDIQKYSKWKLIAEISNDNIIDVAANDTYLIAISKSNFIYKGTLSILNKNPSMDNNLQPLVYTLENALSVTMGENIAYFINKAYHNNGYQAKLDGNNIVLVAMCCGSFPYNLLTLSAGANEIWGYSAYKYIVGNTKNKDVYTELPMVQGLIQPQLTIIPKQMAVGSKKLFILDNNNNLWGRSSKLENKDNFVKMQGPFKSISVKPDLNDDIIYALTTNDTIVTNKYGTFQEFK